MFIQLFALPCPTISPQSLPLSFSPADIKATSDAMVARVDRATNSLIIIGTNSALRSVRLMLDTQVRALQRKSFMPHCTAVYCTALFCSTLYRAVLHCTEVNFIPT